MSEDKEIEITIEITPEMLEAGIMKIYGIDLGYNDEEIVSAIYSAMVREKAKGKHCVVSFKTGKTEAIQIAEDVCRMTHGIDYGR